MKYYEDSFELQHYGVKGMKWGVRKPRNKSHQATTKYPDDKGDENQQKKRRRCAPQGNDSQAC